jgi:hypothetical protein
MKKNEVQIGQTYMVLVSGKVQKVRLDAESPHGGWTGTNLATKRQVRIRTAAKLRRVALTAAQERAADALILKHLETRRVREEYPSEELVVEIDVVENTFCGACGGQLYVLGTLGKLVHLRCRNCGMDSSKEARS